MKLIFKILLLFFLALSASCSKDDLESSSTTDTQNDNGSNISNSEIQNRQNEAIAKVITSSDISASVLVSVKDQFGANINNAQVTIAGQTLVSSNGVVVFNQLDLNKNFVGIKVSHSNFITAIKNFTPTESPIYNIDVILFKGDLKTVSSSVGADLAFDSGVKLNFQPNAFVSANGKRVEGDVSVNTYYHKEGDTNYLLAQPGALVGFDDDELTALASEGMITVDLKDASGNEVFLKEGASVKVTMPADADSPAEIDLWHLNEKHGIWVKTGVAIKKGTVYEFEVTHFSSYNLDVKIDSLEEVNFTVRNADDIAIANQYFEVLVDEVARIFVKTDGRGDFTLLRAPKGEYQLKIFSCNSGETTFSNTLIINSVGDFNFEVDTLESDQSLVQVILFSELVNCANRFDENDTLTLTLFKGTENEKTVMTSLNSGDFYAQLWVCTANNLLADSTEVELNYNSGEYIGTKTFFLQGSSSALVYRPSQEKLLSICDLSDGETVVLDDDLEKAIKSNFGFSEDQVLTTTFTDQVKNLSFPRSPFNDTVDLDSVDFDQIATYFPNLETLYINFYEFSNDNLGALLNFDSIASLIHLKELTLIGGQISNLNALTSLVNLEYLSLSDNGISDASPLSSLISLNSLSISNNSEITDFAFLFNLSQLDHVSFSNMNFSDISFMFQLTNISSLNLSSNNISDFSPLSQLINLESVSIRNEWMVDISSFSQLTNLLELSVSDSRVSDVSSLSNLTNLKFLDLSRNSISDISSLSNLTSLESLNVSTNSISDISVVSNMSQLFNLVARENNISDISKLSGLSKLRHVFISSNNISDISPLFDLVGLWTLYLLNNPIAQEDGDELKSRLPSTDVVFQLF